MVSVIICFQISTGTTSYDLTLPDFLFTIEVYMDLAEMFASDDYGQSIKSIRARASTFFRTRNVFKSNTVGV